MSEAKQRIQFIDLAKGVCISLVVLHHCHIETPYLVYIRMPLYFILSGLFFKTYDGLADFTKRKINKILIPFLFFYSISFLIYLAISHFAPGIRINSEVEKFYFLDPWYSRLCFNNPLWFLLSLFWCNLLYYIVHLVSKKWYVQFISALFFAFVYWAIKDNFFLPLYFHNTLMYFPYFVFGSMLRKTSILYDNEGKSFISKYRDLLLGCLFAVLFLVLANISCTIRPIGVSLRYIYSISGVLALLLILKKIKYLPVISYYGRYSIVILCTSYLVYSPLRVIIPRLIPKLGGVDDYIAFIITMLFEYFIIWFCIRCLPYFTAQKDLIHVGKN